MTKHRKILDHLLLIARDVPPVAAARVASALVYKGEIFALGFCQYKTHPMQKKYGANDKAIYLHSEVDCIQNGIRKVNLDTISKSILYVARSRIVAKKWTAGIARPCCGCQRCIAAFDINKVVYSLDDSGYYVSHNNKEGYE